MVNGALKEKVDIVIIVVACVVGPAVLQVEVEDLRRQKGSTLDRLEACSSSIISYILVNCICILQKRKKTKQTKTKSIILNLI